MRKLMTMACAMIMAAAANASEVVTVEFGEARVNVPARVRFVQGENYGFSVAAKDSVIAKAGPICNILIVFLVEFEKTKQFAFTNFKTIDFDIRSILIIFNRENIVFAGFQRNIGCQTAISV